VLLAGFIAWERRTDDPMLELGFFRSAEFSIGTAAVSLAFFALLGGSFVLTQYLQFAHGYSAIEAGAIMSPMALGLMLGAGSSSKASDHLGASRVITIGLAGLAVVLRADGTVDARYERVSAAPSSRPLPIAWASKSGVVALAAVMVARFLPDRKADDAGRAHVGDHTRAVSEHS
jgi:hypothetical protein